MPPPPGRAARLKPGEPAFSVTLSKHGKAHQSKVSPEISSVTSPISDALLVGLALLVVEVLLDFHQHTRHYTSALMPEDTNDPARAMSHIAPPTSDTDSERAPGTALASLIPGGLETNHCRRHSSLYGLFRTCCRDINTCSSAKFMCSIGVYVNHHIPSFSSSRLRRLHSAIYKPIPRHLQG